MPRAQGQKINKSVKAKKSFEISIGRVTKVEILLFTKHLLVMLKAGLSLGEAIEGLLDQAKGKFKKVLAHVESVIKAGRPLSTGLASYPRYFSNVYVNLIKSGEASGTLEENLEYLSIQQQKEHELRGKIRAAMMYPIFILSATFIIGLGLAIFVLPRIAAVFSSLDVELPLLTRILLKVAGFFQNYGTWLGLGIILFIIFIIWLFRRNFIKSFTHPVLIRLPIIGGIAKQVNLARFSRTLATLLKAGMPIDQALTITSEATENRVYRKAVLKLVEEIKKGNTLAGSLTDYEIIFPKIITQMIKVGEKTGSLDTSLFYLADFYEQEVDNAAKNLATILEPVLLVTIGLIVGTLALSIITPIYKLTGSIGEQ